MKMNYRAEESRIALFETGWGWMGLAGASAGLKMVVLPCESAREVMGKICCCSHYFYTVRDDEYYLDLAARLRAYFNGEAIDLSAELDFGDATSFMKRVWQAAQTIPYGQTRSYGWMAGQIGIRSARAVGQALSKNPLPLFIPCHRVIGSKGALTGFADGLDIKRRLLELESGG